MRPIHVIQPLRKMLTGDEIKQMISFARGGFIIEPDLSDKWKRSSDIVYEHLLRHSLEKEALEFAERQTRMAQYRSRTLHCRALEGGKYICDLHHDVAEFLATDGLNVGRFSFRVGAKIGNAWQDELEHDVIVIERMLTVICSDRQIGATMIEGSKEYVNWMNRLCS